MPIYEYKCTKCGDINVAHRAVDDRENCPRCCSCNGETEKIMSVPANSYVSGYPYVDPVLGMEITDPAHRKRVLKEQGLVERG